MAFGRYASSMQSEAYKSLCEKYGKLKKRNEELEQEVLILRQENNPSTRRGVKRGSRAISKDII